MPAAVRRPTRWPETRPGEESGLNGPADFSAPGWLPGGHLQTLWPLLRKGSPPHYQRERWATPDGDFIDLDWLRAPETAPLLVLFHGLEGSSRSHYAISIMRETAARGWGGVVIHFRGCSGEPNHLLRAYHSGDSEEIDWILRRLSGMGRPLYAVGVSLGGNALLKWLGERGAAAGDVLGAAVAVSAPVDLAAGNEALRTGFSRVYTRHFLATLVPKALQKARRFPGCLDVERIVRSRSLGDFDDAYTAPAHGFSDARDYYRRASAGAYLGGIRVPTLMINGLNDPFLPPHALPNLASLPHAVTLEIPAGGGHVGFVSGGFPGDNGWLAKRIHSFLPA